MQIELNMRNAIFASLVISALLWADGATARRQPIADDTLGGERSLVTPTEINGIPSDLITEGAQRGSNLFHSFQEFSIDEGRAAYFNNPDGVENIFGRVTGGNQSDILGRLGVLGEANLFLINPNGIQFGPNASLDIGGSFLATTADAVGFGDQGWFSAATPEVPSPLLTIHPSAFFYNQMQASPITVRSTTPVDIELGIVGLSVGVGENLALLGGDITVEGGGRLNARGGRIDLGAVESTGTIGLNADRSFSFPVEVRRGEIVFTEAARADVRTPGSGGTIAITAQHINITEGGQLLAGILSGQGFLGSQAGGIELNASEQILMTQSSYIQNEVALDARGNAGNIEITTPILEVLDGAQLSASTRGQGNAGRVAIVVSDRVTFSGVDKNSRFISSAALSRVEQSGNGAGGNIEISTPILEVLDRAALSASTRGQGKAGRVIITASDRVTFNRGVALSNVLAGSDGAGGDIEITTPLLEILNGARLSSSTLGIGEAGRVVIVASDRVLLDGVSSSGFSSGIFGSTASNITGRGGKVSVTTPYLQISNGAVISVRTVNAQLGGGIIIDANQVRAIEGGQIITSTTNAGQAGTITINADSTHFSGRDPSFTRRLQEFGRVITSNEGNGESGLFANTRTDSTGAGGNITVNTNDLIVRDYAQISAQSQGT